MRCRWFRLPYGPDDDHAGAGGGYLSSRDVELTGAVVAHWADAKLKPDATEKARLIGKSVVLETGCEIDFHFVDATTAEIGLNNFVYTLKKQ